MELELMATDDISDSEADAESTINIRANTGSHIAAPVLTSNIIKGDLNIIHNASGITSPQKTQPLGINTVIRQYKRLICSQYEHITEYNSLPGEHVLLCQRYIEPLIIDKYRDQREREEEICAKGESFQEVLSSRSSHESVMNSLFHPDGRGITPGAVILQGNSGNGKSFAVQKIMMDWASGNAYREQFDIVFHLKCKEINRIPGRKSLVEVLSWSCGLTSNDISQMLQQSPERVMFIIDGFDELKLTEDVYHKTPPPDPHQRCSPELTLCALLKGRLQSQSFLLVTTRSTAADTLTKLLKKPYKFTEIMGFSERGVEEYFQKFFSDEELFGKAYMIVKANETLFTACSIPVICWIICTVIRERFNDGADLTSVLETTTSIYVDFVFTLLEHHCQGLSESVPTLLKSLGQLAERGMMERQVLFDEKSVKETVSDPAGSPFLDKFLFKKRVQQETVFSFIHLSFQEFFTALYYLILDKGQSIMKLTPICSYATSDPMHNTTPPRFGDVMKFAFGLLNKDVQRTLNKHGLFIHQNTQAHLKTWFLNEIGAYCYGPLMFNYLYELHEESFVQEAKQAWHDIDAYKFSFNRADCWAMLYCFQCCHILGKLTNLRVTSKELSIIAQELHKFKEIGLGVSNPTDSDLADLMCALTERRILSSQDIDVQVNNNTKSCSVSSLSLKVRHELFINNYTAKLVIQKNETSSTTLLASGVFQKNLFSKNLHPYVPNVVVKSVRFTLHCSGSIDWTKLFQTFDNMDLDALMSAIHSLSKLKNVKLDVPCLNASLCVWTLTISQNCHDLTELRINADYLLEEGTSILRRSCTRRHCTLTYKGLRCNKPSQKCTLYEERQLSCNQMMKMHVDCRGFSEEGLRLPLFWD